MGADDGHAATAAALESGPTAVALTPWSRLRWWRRCSARSSSAWPPRSSKGKRRRAADLRIADPRLLWRLAHRPLWVAGIVADGVSALLHVVALSFGPITLVQPLGVTGLLFAMPIVAVLRRQRISARDLSAALVVLAALSVLLALLPTAGSATLGTVPRPGRAAGRDAGVRRGGGGGRRGDTASGQVPDPRGRRRGVVRDRGGAGPGAAGDARAAALRGIGRRLGRRHRPADTRRLPAAAERLPVGSLLGFAGHRSGRRPDRRGSRRRVGVERAAARRCRGRSSARSPAPGW